MVNVRTTGRSAEILTPLAAGLVLVAVSNVLSLGVMITLIHLAILLGLGARLPRNPWLTGAIVASPGLVVGLVRAAGDSVGSLGLMLLVAPVALGLSGLLVKGGTFLTSAEGNGTGLDPDTAAAAVDGTRRKAFETKAQRGRFLVIVAVVLFLATSLLDTLGDRGADRAANHRIEEITTALEGETASTMRTAFVPWAYGGGPSDLPGGPYVVAAPGMDRFEARAEVHYLTKDRCIYVTVADDGLVTTEVKNRGCRG